MDLQKNNLFVVGTPIGNLGDLSERAREILSSVSFIACEDTRVTGKLLSGVGIPKVPLVALHEHSTERDVEAIVERLKQEPGAYVTDAGTPGISDPGGKLVEACHRSEVVVAGIPGASAGITALSMSGFPAVPHTFLGFPPHKKGRKTFFERIRETNHTIVLYESKHRIIKTLAALPEERLCFVARELTKLHETTYRGTVEDVMKAVEADSQKGEFTIILAPTNW